ncbi:MAG: FMN-binding negative transcriptional regulator [Ignavibacteria bacterium]|nr:FMN-binding negative transcriptional regulator [Ignavibacteria bacterium]
MYTPKHFEMTDRDEIFDFIRNNSFAILISTNSGKLNATHLPVLLKSDEGENGYLYAHVAKANHQMKDISEEVLVIFPGAHKYISPAWYETNQTVPTWNYISVHVYGIIKILEDRESKMEIIKDVVKYFEGDESKYKVEDLKESYFEGQLRGITAFKIEITKIEGKKKISQNHPEERQQRVIEKLLSFDDENSNDIAEHMRKNFDSKS